MTNSLVAPRPRPLERAGAVTPHAPAVTPHAADAVTRRGSTAAVHAPAACALLLEQQWRGP
jgi:hypothetical protein